MPGILFGSISTLADTSELQRDAFNRAFAQHGLDWTWDRTTYRTMLAAAGGAKRIAAYADERGETVDADAVHATKSELFQQALGETALRPRPGVAETVAAAKQQGMKVALVTTTSPANVSALLDGLAASLDSADFDLLVDSDVVDATKPDPAAYRYALEQLDLEADEAVAIEDNVEGMQAAVAAGLPCVAFPNENTAGGDFADAEEVDAIDLDQLRRLISE